MVKSHNLSHPLILNTPIVLSQICVLYINSLLDHGFWGLFNIRILLNPINYSSITMNHPFNSRNSIIWVCLKIGYIPNEIAIKYRDNDQQAVQILAGCFLANPLNESSKAFGPERRGCERKGGVTA